MVDDLMTILYLMTKPYFLCEVLPYWIGFALIPFIARVLCDFFDL